MKNLFKSMMFVAVAAMAFTSCAKDEESVITPESKNITLSFSSEKPELEGTRTEHNGTTVVWSSGDRIKLAYTLDGKYMGADASDTPKFYTSNNAVITAVDDTHNTATFNVNNSFKDSSTGEYKFFALYPSDAYAGSNATIANAPVVPVKVADTQSPKAASFDSAADLMIGHSTEAYTGIPADRMVSLLWTRLVAHAQISFTNISAVDGEVVNFVTFTAEEGKQLTGDYNLNIETGEFTATTASNSIKLVGEGLALNNGSLAAWFCSLPFTTSQFTVVIDTNKATYTREINAGKELNFMQNRHNTLTINMASAAKEEKAAPAEFWQLVTDGVNIGDNIIIAAAGSDDAMSTKQNNSNRDAQAITKSDDKNTVTFSEETVQIFEVVNGNKSGTVAFKCINGDHVGEYIYAASSSSNHLKTHATIDDNASWTVTVTSAGIATCKANGTNSHNLIKKNSSSALFSCYTGGQADIAIYRRETGVPPTPAPSISVDPTELTIPTAGGDQNVTVTAKNFGTYTVSAVSDNTHFTTAVSGNVVTVTAPANETDAEISGTVTITVTDGTNTLTAEVAVKQVAVGASVSKYVKVTSAPADWSGTYLIVYEENATSGKVFNNVDATIGCISATIDNYTIAVTSDLEAEQVVIAPMTGGYSIKGKKGYIYGTSGSNTINFSNNTEHLNTIEYSSNSVKITSNTSVFRFNTGGRFRYYKSTTYQDQKAIQLYKLEN